MELPFAFLSDEVAAAQTSGLVNLVFSRQTGFFECEHPFIDKPMVITEPAVPITRLFGLGSKLYPSNIPPMLRPSAPEVSPLLCSFQHTAISLQLANQLSNSKLKFGKNHFIYSFRISKNHLIFVWIEDLNVSGVTCQTVRFAFIQITNCKKCRGIFVLVWCVFCTVTNAIR